MKLPTYQDHIEVRELDVEGTKNTPGFLKGEDQWFWVKDDSGAWDGPNKDWRGHHRHHFFKDVKKFDTVITAGANLGMYVRFYAKKFNWVYAFEPDPLNFHCMVINNQRDNVIKMQAALGREAGFCKVNNNGRGNRGAFSITVPNSKLDATGAIIPVITIDSLPWKTVDLIQLDVEGFEINVLHGAKETIKKFQPVVIAENGHKPDIKQLMDTLKYKDAGRSVSDTVYIPK
jgi:FkbM family methyltransferase